MSARRDEGLASLELALLLTVLLAMLALVTPLAYLFYERVQLGKASGDVIRFATSRSDKDRETTGTVVGSTVTYVIPADDLPKETTYPAEASRAYTGRGTPSVTSKTRAKDTDCPSGYRRTITLSTTVNVGAFTGLLLGGPTQTLSATASSCEE